MKLSRTTALTAALLTAAVVSFTGSAQAQAQAQPQAQPWGWGARMAPSGYGYGIGYGCPCYILPPTYSYTTGWNYPGLGVYPGNGAPGYYAYQPGVRRNWQ
jgi:hypothetical protein